MDPPHSNHSVSYGESVSYDHTGYQSTHYPQYNDQYYESSAPSYANDYDHNPPSQWQGIHDDIAHAHQSLDLHAHSTSQSYHPPPFPAQADVWVHPNYHGHGVPGDRESHPSISDWDALDGMAVQPSAPLEAHLRPRYAVAPHNALSADEIYQNANMLSNAHHQHVAPYPSYASSPPVSAEAVWKEYHESGKREATTSPLSFSSSAPYASPSSYTSTSSYASPTRDLIHEPVYHSWSDTPDARETHANPVVQQMPISHPPAPVSPVAQQLVYPDHPPNTTHISIDPRYNMIVPSQSGPSYDTVRRHAASSSTSSSGSRKRSGEYDDVAFETAAAGGPHMTVPSQSVINFSRSPMGYGQGIVTEKPSLPDRKPVLACMFCRKRKIACTPAPPEEDDRTCNQCARRNLDCEYPTESRRGLKKGKPPHIITEEEIRALGAGLRRPDNRSSNHPYPASNSRRRPKSLE